MIGQFFLKRHSQERRSENEPRNETFDSAYFLHVDSLIRLENVRFRGEQALGVSATAGCFRPIVGGQATVLA